MDPWLLAVALVGGAATLLLYLALRPLDARCPKCRSREIELVGGVGNTATCRACKHRRMLGRTDDGSCPTPSDKVSLRERPTGT
jgi:hypothetical protein